jgi:hypothetical protein
MMQWAWHRDRWTTAKAAVEEAASFDGCLVTLARHPTVALAIAQIDAAERAIESVANEMLRGEHDGDED